MKAALRAAARASENPERIARIPEILERTKRELEDLGSR
jgi:hypothetical protein